MRAASARGAELTQLNKVAHVEQYGSRTRLRGA